jgi:hypothetical protein
MANLPARAPARGPVIVATRSIADAVPQLADSTPLVDLVGRWLHVYAIERIESEGFGDGVKLHVREADDRSVEIGEEFAVVTFAYRFRAIGRAILNGQQWIALEPPVRGKVVTYPTAKGQGFDLIAE